MTDICLIKGEERLGGGVSSLPSGRKILAPGNDVCANLSTHYASLLISINSFLASKAGAIFLLHTAGFAVAVRL